MSTAPAIVIAAHNRPGALSRLLRSLDRADIAADTTLIVSIDGGGSAAVNVRAAANGVSWPHGQFRVVEHQPLGLVEHFYRCGDLTSEFGSVVLLEDDLVVGPSFHQWATAALAHAEDEPQVAGVSLAAPHFDGYRHLPFEPVIDGSDAFYVQVPWYDGMAWTAAMWERFRSHTFGPTTAIHASFETLADDEWFPDAVRYLVETNRYYLLPRHAHASNTGAAGTHFDNATDYFQVQLTMRGPNTWRLRTLTDSLSVYDDHLELVPDVLKRLTTGLDGYDITVDLLGVRSLDSVSTPHILTTRQVNTAIRSWGASMHPLVANLTHNVPGDGIRLADTAEVISDARSNAESLATLRNHATRGRTPSTRESARLLADAITRRLRLGRR